MERADQPAAFAVGFGGYRAGIDYAEVGRFAGVYTRNTAVSQGCRDGAGLGEIEFTSES